MFGESVLNDAVAMVLYDTLCRFIDQGGTVTVRQGFQGLGIFLGIFLGSAVLGAIVAFLASLLYKTGFYNVWLDPGRKPDEHVHEEKDVYEAILVIIIAFCGYMLSAGLGLSGITTIVICGMIMR